MCYSYLLYYRYLILYYYLLAGRIIQLFYGCTIRYQTSWQRSLGGRDYPKGNIPAFLRHNLVISTHKMYFLFRSRERRSSRGLKRGNSIRELAYSNSWGNRCSKTRTNLFLIIFYFLRGRRGLRRCFSRVLSSGDTSGEMPDSMTYIQVSSRINVFASSMLCNLGQVNSAAKSLIVIKRTWWSSQSIVLATYPSTVNTKL